MNTNNQQCGTHLIIELYDVEFDKLNSSKDIEICLKNSAIDSGATILYSYFHDFIPYGITGVIVLAESHISIHTWPEKGYAALDIFMCNGMNPLLCMNTILTHFDTINYKLNKLIRGI